MSDFYGLFSKGNKKHLSVFLRNHRNEGGRCCMVYEGPWKSWFIYQFRQKFNMYIFSNHFTLTLMVGKEKPLKVEIYILVWFLADKVNRQQNDLICTFNVTGLLIAKTFCTSMKRIAKTLWRIVGLFIKDWNEFHQSTDCLHPQRFTVDSYGNYSTKRVVFRNNKITTQNKEPNNVLRKWST